METPGYLKFAEKITYNGLVELWQDHNYIYVARQGDLKHLTDFSIRQHGETTAHLLAVTYMNAFKEGHNDGRETSMNVFFGKE
jgi:hypothetical protein